MMLLLRLLLFAQAPSTTAATGHQHDHGGGTRWSDEQLAELERKWGARWYTPSYQPPLLPIPPLQNTRWPP